MSSLLQSGYLAVLDAKPKDELRTHVARFAEELGFQTVTAITVIDHLSKDSEFICVDTMLDAYREVAEDRACVHC